MVAAGRRGAQRLAVALLAADDAAAAFERTMFKGVATNEIAKQKYRSVVQSLLIFALSPARKFVLPPVETTGTTTVEATTREGGATCESASTTTCRTMSHITVTADPDSGDDDIEPDGAAATAPLLAPSIGGFGGRAGSILLTLFENAFEFADRSGKFSVAPETITAALRPRELRIGPIGCPDKMARWVESTRQLCRLRFVDLYGGIAGPLLSAAFTAGAPLEELEIVGRLTRAHTVLQFLCATRAPALAASRGRGWRPGDAPLQKTSPTAGCFPGLRVLRLPQADFSGADLRDLCVMAPALEVIVGRERPCVTAGHWRDFLQRMARLHTLEMVTHSDDTTNCFYNALGAPGFAPACGHTLRVLHRFPVARFGPMQDALNAVARQFPRLESLALPADVFNALTTHELGDDVAAGKAALRAALVAATPHCRTLKLLSRTCTPDGRVALGCLHVEALQHLGSVLPHLRVLGPVVVSHTAPPLDVLQLLLDDAALSRRAERVAAAQARVARAEASVRNGRRRVRDVKRAANSDTTADAGADADANTGAAGASAACSDPCGQTAGPQRRARSAPAADQNRLVAGDGHALDAPFTLDGACQSGLCVAAAADPTSARASPLPLIAAVAVVKSAVADIGRKAAALTTVPRTPGAQLRELHITGPVTREELAAVVRRFPRLRVLQCEYGGPCPLAAPSPDSSTPQRDLAVAEAAFIGWLGAVVDVSGVTHDRSASAASTVLQPPQSAMPRLRELRRLRVERPPLDGERDAAAMGALESLRARSQVLIEFVHRPPAHGDVY
jgi:hypothetical protein